MQPTITLAPLNAADHDAALQNVYRQTPGYWQLYNLPSAPADQAERDFAAAAAEAGRTLMGVVLVRGQGNNLRSDLIGVVDFRMNWPNEGVAYVGMVLIAAGFQRQGYATQAWRLIEPWLRDSADIATARCGVEQFNPDALQFFQSLGFALTGEANRLRVGDKFVRLLYMEKGLVQEA